MTSIICAKEILEEVIEKSLVSSTGVKQRRVEAEPPQNILEQFIFPGGVQCQDDLLIVC